jgi:hypothetical protein
VICNCLCNGECYICNGVCLFIWCMYSFVCTICKSLLEVDYDEAEFLVEKDEG